MANEAIDKIKAEMAKENNPYVQIVGQFLLNHLKQHPEAEKQVMAKDKTIMKSLDEMRKEAEKSRVGSVAVLSDDQGFAIVLKYFGIDGKPDGKGPAAPVKAGEPAKEAVPSFDVKLDDFL